MTETAVGKFIFGVLYAKINSIILISACSMYSFNYLDLIVYSVVS